MLPDWVFDDQDRRLMLAALEEAEKAFSAGEVPVGAVVARDGVILARAANHREESGDVSAHAEILAMRAAGAAAGDWRLEGATLYVTLEPCPLCISACRQARLDLVVWGAPDPRAGACGTVLDLAEDPRLGPPLAHRGGLYAEEAGTLLRRFFAKRRDSS